MGLTPPLEGGSERHIYELAVRNKNAVVLTQKGSDCLNKIELPVMNISSFLRNISFFMMCLLYSLKLLLVKKYDLIHIHDNLLYFLVPLLKLRYKVIVTIHGITGFHFYENKRLWFFFSTSLRFATHLISVSVNDKKLLDQTFKHVSYIPNGVDTGLYSTFKVPVEKKITFLGRIHEQKGLTYLLEAFTSFKKKYPSYQLVLIGKSQGPYYEALKNKFDQKNIIWKGFISDRKEIFKLLASSEILIYPSLFEALPWPALLEGLGSGRPVIASDLEGMRTIFTDQKDLYLVPPHDAKSILTALETLLNDKKLISSLGKNGKKLVNTYSWDLISQQVQDLYNYV